jgi:type II secretory ATPase GspE/PulE/Tfp pilus assembly ATPase PilB-like protein
MILIPTAILFGLFLFWMGMVASVHRMARYQGGAERALSLTFYSFGIVGLLILLGRRWDSPELEEFADGLMGTSASDGPVDWESFAEFGDEEIEGAGATGGDGWETGDMEPEPGVDPESGRGIARKIIRRAIVERATDIHLEPERTQLKIRFRIDGVLHTMGSQPASMAPSVVSAVKVMADMDVAERRRAQDGSFNFRVGHREVDVRASTIGTSHGEKMVLRILDKSESMLDLESLGLSHATYEKLHSIVRSPHGMLIACGPTGSGKTTTLYAALQEVDRDTRNVITIEDPIEYNLEGANQHAVKEDADITFASLLRTALRQDPDVLMVGEIRDKETAEIAMQAAMTGHFVYTTVHANDTVGVVFRLLNLDVPAYMISSSLRAILAQRLVRKICTSCRKVRKPTEKELETFGENGFETDDIDSLYEGEGCGKCHGSGYAGRVGVFELLQMNDEIRSLVQEGASIVKLKEAAEQSGLVHLRQQALRKAKEGITTMEEALRATG